ncbi:MAG: hypothetical protein HRU70_09305 [Phycisphaeraceae bacterium]|nr:MAG: hypothetical protein HRU70_09305 [Phycisphaeraceae bacterium]
MKCVSAVAVLACTAGSVLAGDISQVNSGVLDLRRFNDFPTSELTVVNDGLNEISFRETFAAGTVGNFANKHLAYLSTDGSNAFGMSRSQSWMLMMDIRIDAPAGSPRKEGAIQIENPRPGLGYTDEGRILVASDGEVAVFGGVMPFTGLGNVYTLGTTAHMIFEFFAPGEVDAKGAYRLTFIDAVTGAHSSGLKIWGDETDGTAGFNEGTRIALVAQNQRNPVIDDSSFIQYSNISIVPAPGALGLIGLMGLAAARRRR